MGLPLHLIPNVLKCNVLCRFYPDCVGVTMVEAAGIEPASGSAPTYASTCIAFLLRFAASGRVRPASRGR